MAKKRATPAPLRKLSWTETELRNFIAASSDRLDAVIDILGKVETKMSGPSPPRRVYLTLADEISLTNRYYQQESKIELRPPGLALHADENGIIKLTAADCQRLARLLAAIVPSSHSEGPIQFPTNA